MYVTYNISDTVRVPPKEFGGKLKEKILKLAQEEYEGLLDEDMGVIVAVTDVEDVGEGKVVPGDGAAYYNAKINMLAYKPEIHELVEGTISEITEFGAFIKTGPIEGLIHVSQIMDDYINYDAKMPGFIGKESKRKLTTNDTVMARIVTVSLKGTLSSSKIGLTMRQDGLGKKDWKKLSKKPETTTQGKSQTKPVERKEKAKKEANLAKSKQKTVQPKAQKAKEEKEKSIQPKAQESKGEKEEPIQKESEAKEEKEEPKEEAK